MTYDGFCELPTSDSFSYVWALTKNRWRLRRLHILKRAAQLLFIWWVSIHNRSLSVVMLILLQHSHCTFVTILWDLCLAVRQPDDLHTSTFFPICIHFRTCGTSILEDATFHRMNWYKFLYGNPCRAIETFFHSDSCLSDFWFSTHFSHSAAWRTRRRFRLCRFCTLIDIVTETAIVSYRTLPVGFPLPDNLQEFFVHAFLSPDSWPPRFFHLFRFWPHNSWFVDSARYFFSPLSSICDNQVQLYSDESS